MKNMKRTAWSAALVLVSAAASGCASYLAPLAGGYGRYPAARRAHMAAINPDDAARGRWDRVMRLPAGAVIDVLTMDGAAYVGPIAGIDGYRVRVVAGGIEEEITRADVLRIDLVDLPGSETAAVAKRAAAGAILGVGAMALLGGVIGGEAWPPPGVLLRGGAALGGVSGGQAALASRRPRLIYLAENQQPAARQSGRRCPTGCAGTSGDSPHQRRGQREQLHGAAVADRRR